MKQWSFSLRNVLVIGLWLGSCSGSLPALNINISATTVSGLSAGGFFASQFHVAHSSIVQGCAMFSGGPYFCAEGRYFYVATQCSSFPLFIDTSYLVKKTLHFQQKGVIDDTANLEGDLVYLFHGSNDGDIVKGVSSKAKKYYHKFKSVVNESLNEVPVGHGYPTQNYGIECQKTGKPFLNNCQFDGAYHSLSAIIPGLKPPGNASQFHLLTFNQKPYHSSRSSLNDIGYIYVPLACQNLELCVVHIAFHACHQTLQDVGKDFVANTGLNAVAEANNIVVLYPQVRASDLDPINPDGCWDYWGYTETELPTLAAHKYVTQKAVQIRAVYDMLLNVSGAASSSH